MFVSKKEIVAFKLLIVSFYSHFDTNIGLVYN